MTNAFSISITISANPIPRGDQSVDKSPHADIALSVASARESIRLLNCDDLETARAVGAFAGLYWINELITASASELKVVLTLNGFGEPKSLVTRTVTIKNCFAAGEQKHLFETNGDCASVTEAITGENDAFESELKEAFREASEIASLTADVADSYMRFSAQKKVRGMTKRAR